MRGLLIDTEKLEARVVEINDADHLQEYYRLLNCHLIDIAYRKIGGKYYDIIVDDEGLFVDEPKVSALDPNNEPALVGNLLVLNYDGEGGETSLTDEDIARVQEFVAHGFVQNRETGEVQPRIFITNVEV